jgi:hypothetical protein
MLSRLMSRFLKRFLKNLPSKKYLRISCLGGLRRVKKQKRQPGGTPTFSGSGKNNNRDLGKSSIYLQKRLFLVVSF